MPAAAWVAWAVLAVGWAIWVSQLVRRKHAAVQAEKVDRRARVGVALQSLAYAALWGTSFRQPAPGLVRLAVTATFAALGCLLLAGAMRALGRHWRIDAGLNADHQLVRTGPYRLVRHPIYLSMFCMLIATGAVTASLPVLGAAALLFLIGCEVRVRVEEQLLAGRFGGEFAAYQRRVRAYLPLVR